MNGFEIAAIITSVAVLVYAVLTGYANYIDARYQPEDDKSWMRKLVEENPHLVANTGMKFRDDTPPKEGNAGDYFQPDFDVTENQLKMIIQVPDAKEEKEVEVNLIGKEELSIAFCHHNGGKYIHYAAGIHIGQPVENLRTEFENGVMTITLDRIEKGAPPQRQPKQYDA